LAHGNADTRSYLRRLLSRYDVLAVADGETALSAARHGCYDLVLADVMLPKLNGIDLVRTLRVDPLTRTLAIVLLSAPTGAQASIEEFEIAVDEHLVQPFTARKVLARIGAHVELGRFRRDGATRQMHLRGEAEALQHRLAFLAQVGDLLSSLDYEPAAQAVARVAVSHLAQLCTIDVLDANSEIQNIGLAHAEPSQEERIRELYIRHPVTRLSAHPVAVAIRTGQVQVLPTSDHSREAAEDDGYAQWAPFQSVGMQTAIVVPLAARGQVLGAISFWSTSQDSPGATDQTLAAAVARRVSLALDNARLYQQARRAEEGYRQLFWRGLQSLLGGTTDSDVPVARSGMAEVGGPSPSRPPTEPRPRLLDDVPPQMPSSPLTPREREVLEALATGASTRRIAAQLGVSDNAVRYYIKNLFTKLQVHSRAELVVFALRVGFAPSS
jgi:DNA-binding NarL/FixJ family response regulator